MPIKQIPGARPVIAVDPPPVTTIDATVARGLEHHSPYAQRLAGHIRDDALILARILDNEAERHNLITENAARHRRAGDPTAPHTQPAAVPS